MHYIRGRSTSRRFWCGTAASRRECRRRGCRRCRAPSFIAGAEAAAEASSSVERPSFCSWLGLSGPAASRAAAALGEEDAAADAEMGNPGEVRRRSRLRPQSLSASHSAAADDEAVNKMHSDEQPSFYVQLQKLRKQSIDAQAQQEGQQQQRGEAGEQPSAEAGGSATDSEGTAGGGGAPVASAGGGAGAGFMASAGAAAQQVGKPALKGDGSAPLQDGVPARQPALGLMTPNETKKQVRRCAPCLSAAALNRAFPTASICPVSHRNST